MQLLARQTNTDMAFWIISSIAPTAPPRDVTPSTTSKSVNVSWSIIECIERNGEITNYTVVFQEQGGVPACKNQVSISHTFFFDLPFPLHCGDPFPFPISTTFIVPQLPVLNVRSVCVITLLNKNNCYVIFVNVHSVSVLSTPYTHVGGNFVLLLP